MSIMDRISVGICIERTYETLPASHYIYEPPIFITKTIIECLFIFLEFFPAAVVVCAVKCLKYQYILGIIIIKLY